MPWAFLAIALPVPTDVTLPSYSPALGEAGRWAHATFITDCLPSRGLWKPAWDVFPGQEGGCL